MLWWFVDTDRGRAVFKAKSTTFNFEVFMKARALTRCTEIFQAQLRRT